MEEHSDLIYDVGLFDGADTAYYLFRGYNVVAVDANPLMIEKARLRFSKEILAKRLTLLNVGISKTPGTATFWISENPAWSSFDRTLASRGGTAHRSIRVSAVPFSQLLAQYGVPHYLKIDIEGNDGLCVEALRGAKLPKYISVEAECVGGSATHSDEEPVAMLELLRDVGYQRFKLVNQSRLAPVGSDVADLCMHVVTSAARGRLRVRGLCGIAERFTEPARLAAAFGFVFSPGCSGPWGDDIRGGWMTFEKARSIYRRKRRLFFSPKRDWHDWHATY
jgi:FkbM family methyltransferase